MKRAAKKSLKKVAVIMGSDSDFPVMKDAIQVLTEFGVGFEVQVVSAHRTPEKMMKFADQAEKNGIQVIIAGAGGAAHLPGMVASLTTLPVIGVPVELKKLQGIDSLLSIAQMPKGVPVATVAIDNSYNAGLLALRMLALQDQSLSQKLKTFQTRQKTKVNDSNRNLQRTVRRLNKK